MMQCPKCRRKKRVMTKLEQVKGKKYWVSKCVECKTAIKMDDYETGTEKKR
jgi:hypothetical protein